MHVLHLKPTHNAVKVYYAAGKKLADLHVNYEQQPKYPLTFIEKEGEPLDWRVEKMKLSKDKKQIVYNHFLTLDGIPPETFDTASATSPRCTGLSTSTGSKPTNAAASSTTPTAPMSQTIS